jgi:regulator of protease activity HflC (stomatin/prohibitin superfamily)
MVPGIVVVLYVLSGIKITNQWERRPIKRFGKYIRTLGPGFAWVEPFFTSVIETVDMQDQVDSVYQELGYKDLPTLQTHDNVPISFTVILTWKVVDAARFVLEVQDGHDAVYQRCLTIISEFASNTELDQILHERQALYGRIGKPLQDAISGWGAEVIAIEIKDVSIVDSGIQEAIAMKARAQKEGEAELTRAKMQAQIAEQLKEAAAVYDADAWKLKGFETLLELCRSSQNNTVMIPTDLFQGIAKVLGK